MLKINYFKRIKANFINIKLNISFMEEKKIYDEKFLEESFNNPDSNEEVLDDQLANINNDLKELEKQINSTENSIKKIDQEITKINKQA